ncbi:MAG: hypothetical protein RL062_1220 [Bacteroidota bacterium]
MGSIPVGATVKTPPNREEFFIESCSIPVGVVVDSFSLREKKDFDSRRSCL